MIIKEIIKIKDLSEIKSYIVNYDVFDNNIAIATETKEIYAIKYSINTEEEIIKRIEDLKTRLEQNVNITNNDKKLFSNGFIASTIYSLAIIALSIYFSSILPLIFLTAPAIICGQLINVLKEYKKELKQTNLSLDILKSTLYIKQMEFQKKKAKECEKEIAKQSNQKSTCELLRELKEQLVEEPNEEKDKIMTKHK